MKILFLILSISISISLSAQQWQSLFNGKDLTGWKQLGGAAKYEVRNGEIVGITVANTPNSFLVTEKDYGDFIFEADVQLDSAFNSGIQFRSESVASYLNGRVHGYQMEIDPSARNWSGGIYDESRRGWLYPMELNAKNKFSFKTGQWYHYRIECIGNSLKTFVNGKAMAHVYDNTTAKGFFALQVHTIGNAAEAGRSIRWKNIRIQTTNLKPAPDDVTMTVANFIPNNISPVEAKQGFTLLWDGATTNGWRGAYKDHFPEKGWEIKDGVLHVLASSGAESQNGGDIVTTGTYGAFILDFEFKITDSANSGVKYFVTESEQNKGSAIGLEYQILDDAKHPDAKLGSIGNRTLSSLYDLIPRIKHPNAYREIGEWNKGRIVVYPDNRIEHWLNGIKTVEYQRGTQYYYALVARSKYEHWPNFGMADKGHILLQDHGNHVMFRSIKIKTLN
ncbi:MAG: DUF1080 domain-containing protein [Bacteroidetes bacterium]|nr:DUF1080 domain-containing protein [Bacteroidota bacterium]